MMEGWLVLVPTLELELELQVSVRDVDDFRVGEVPEGFIYFAPAASRFAIGGVELVELELIGPLGRTGVIGQRQRPPRARSWI